MGLGGISVTSLLIILLIIVVLFGTKRIRTIGNDLGAALRSFREGIEGEKKQDSDANAKRQSEPEDK